MPPAAVKACLLKTLITHLRISRKCNKCFSLALAWCRLTDRLRASHQKSGVKEWTPKCKVSSTQTVGKQGEGQAALQQSYLATKQGP